MLITRKLTSNGVGVGLGHQTTILSLMTISSGGIQRRGQTGDKADDRECQQQAMERRFNHGGLPLHLAESRPYQSPAITSRSISRAVPASSPILRIAYGRQPEVTLDDFIAMGSLASSCRAWPGSNAKRTSCPATDQCYIGWNEAEWDLDEGFRSGLLCSSSVVSAWTAWVSENTSPSRSWSIF